MSETQATYDPTPTSETRISGYPLPGWRTKRIESLPRALDGGIGWSVLLERTLESERIQSAHATSIIGLFDAWDHAIRMAKDLDKEGNSNVG